MKAPSLSFHFPWLQLNNPTISFISPSIRWKIIQLIQINYLMRPIIKLFRQSVFLQGSVIFLVFGSIYCCSINKYDGFLLINHFHKRLLDYFFIFFTNLGDGLVSVLVMLLLLIKKKTGWCLQVLISFLLAGILVQISKNLAHFPRPEQYFGIGLIHYFPGITCTGYASFPSGHTATIFALTTLLSLYFPDKMIGVFLLLIAMMTGFSRVYLSQHFPEDVLAGAVIGLSSAILTRIYLPESLLLSKMTRNRLI
jgi:membrane-associated phospholipid phosphatase